VAGVVSLNQARKARSKVKKHAQAAENSVKFGLSKAQKQANKTREASATRHLDGHKRGGDD